MKKTEYTLHPYSFYLNCWKQTLCLSCHPAMSYFDDRNDVVERFLTWMTKFKVRRNKEMDVEDTISCIVVGIRNIVPDFAPITICEILGVIMKRSDDYKPIHVSNTLSWCRKNFLEAGKVWDNLILELSRPYCTNTSDRFEIRIFLQWFTVQCLVNDSDTKVSKWEENTEALEELVHTYSGPIKQYIECFTFRKILLALSRKPIISNMSIKTKTVYYFTNVVMTRLHDLRDLWMSQVNIPALDCNQSSISFCIQSYLISDLLTREVTKFEDVVKSVKELVDLVNNLSDSGMRDSAVTHVLERVVRVQKKCDDMFAFRERLVAQLMEIGNTWTEIAAKWNSDMKYANLRMGRNCDINVHNLFMDILELLLNVKADVSLGLDICNRITTTIIVNALSEFLAMGVICRVVSQCRSLDECYLGDLELVLGMKMDRNNPLPNFNV